MHAKCSEAKAIAMQIYESAMSSQLDGTLPRDSYEISQVQQAVIEGCIVWFQTETYEVSTLSSEKYLDELTVRNSTRIGNSLYGIKNPRLARIFHIGGNEVSHLGAL